MEASVRVPNSNAQWKWSSACGMRWDLFRQRTIDRSHFRMRFEYELLCWDPKDGELWVHREQGCETQTKNLKKVLDQFFFFQYLYIFKRITSQKHQHATTHTGHVQGDITFINLLQSPLPEESDSFQQIHLWSKIGYRSKSWNCYQKLLIQKYFCSINYKTNNNKKLTGTLPLEGYSSFVTLFFLNFAIGNLSVLFNTI